MAQSDQTVQNATFPSVRADINDNLAALYSQSSGASAPTVTVAFQPWVDNSVSPPIWKIRNAANTGWITVGVLDASFEVGGVTPIANGGTGQTTAADAINALLPSQTGNAGKFLSTNGTAVSWLTTLSSVTIQVFTTSGTYTPTAAKTSYLVFAVGGGGGGGAGGVNTSLGRAGSGGGGGSGGCAFRIYNNTELGSTATVTIGAAGAAAGSGGNTSFNPAGTGVTITGVGGSAGETSSVTGIPAGAGGAGTGGAGGGVTNSLITMTGNTGGVGSTDTDGTDLLSTGGTGAAPVFWGAGRGGNGGSTGGGSAGEAGIVVVLEF